jgi:hypothetical protein
VNPETFPGPQIHRAGLQENKNEPCQFSMNPYYYLAMFIAKKKLGS